MELPSRESDAGPNAADDQPDWMDYVQEAIESLLEAQRVSGSYKWSQVSKLITEASDYCESALELLP
jgi:hypothetical protein